MSLPQEWHLFHTPSAATRTTSPGGAETRPHARAPLRSGLLGATPGLGRTSTAGPAELDGNVVTDAGRRFLRRRCRLETSCSSRPITHARPASSPLPEGSADPGAKVGVQARSGRQTGRDPTAKWFPQTRAAPHPSSPRTFETRPPFGFSGILLPPLSAPRERRTFTVLTPSTSPFSRERSVIL